jgi:hypothetical protein
MSESTVGEGVAHHWYARPVLLCEDLARQDKSRLFVDFGTLVANREGVGNFSFP